MKLKATQQQEWNARQAGCRWELAMLAREDARRLRSKGLHVAGMMAQTGLTETQVYAVIRAMEAQATDSPN